jgi:hypothetical protein
MALVTLWLEATADTGEDHEVKSHHVSTTKEEFLLQASAVWDTMEDLDRRARSIRIPDPEDVTVVHDPLPER